ncbi:LysM peptidoglycan-binding domain-containing protein [Citricoccus sp. SGAir0253]|uniref:LysM peptidoglycan-binding domain-containing protein n=1 Tax=Citricoccus sp. SGAir0253 TaxID=2567881 RepID=UPI0010CD2607|nr:LysM peptidoglycan-binding domain-containing protein [Citricoccus sp. SGAir0253]QCU78489.1 LysM peptidoglycan-binding domain-containing protein [Citricoccus sp. SGAir0253]
MSTAASIGVPVHRVAGFRLNRRGRLLLLGLPVIVLAVLAAAAAVFFGAHAVAPAAASPERSAPALRSVTVDYGDTLWSLAGEAVPEGPRNETILRIGELNDLSGPDLQPGQVLFVPAAG